MLPEGRLAHDLVSRTSSKVIVLGSLNSPALIVSVPEAPALENTKVSEVPGEEVSGSGATILSAGTSDAPETLPETCRG